MGNIVYWTSINVCIHNFPKNYYWVGITALETYAKETKNIHSSRKIDIIKMPYDVEGRTQANCWKIIETIKGADNQGEEQLNAIREAVKNVKIDFDKEGITVETNQQFFRDYYVIIFLVKCYLYEAYAEKYEHLVAKRIRKFIMETYKLLRVDFISHMEGYITLYYSSNSGFLINDMNKRRDEIVKKGCKEKQKMNEPNVLMEQNKENKRFTQFTNVVTANVDREKKNDPIKQD